MFIDATTCPGFTIQVLDQPFIAKQPDRVNVIRSLLADSFSESNPLCSFLRIQSDRLRDNLFRPVVQKAVRDELSLVCVDNASDSIAAVFLNEDFYETVFPDRQVVQALQNEMPELRPILELLSHLGESLVKKRFSNGLLEPKMVFHANLLATSREYRQRGLAQGLSTATVKLAKQLYYDFICVEPTNPISNHIWIDNLRAITEVAIPTRDFQMPDGSRPFANGHFETESTIALLALQHDRDNHDKEEPHPPKRMKTTLETRPNHASGQQHSQPAIRATSGSWKASLLAYLNNPADTKNVVYVDDSVMAIRDMYPKAQRHFLVMPRDSRYRSYQDLTAADIPLLEKLHDVAKKLIAKHPKLQFRVGVHAVPSMDHLHLHVISQDFDSPSLKNKKHWNSFTTNFFVSYEELLQSIRNHGNLTKFRARETRLKDDLKCHICHQPQKNIPTLKQHISECCGKQR